MMLHAPRSEVRFEDHAWLATVVLVGKGSLSEDGSGTNGEE